MRRLIRVGIIFGFAIIGTIVLGNAAERRLIYPFDKTYVTPDKAGLLQVRERRFESNGETLIAWTAKPEPEHPVILYFHGNAGNLAARAGRFGRFLSRGYGLFAPAYRGSSGSTGTPSEAALSGDAVSDVSAYGSK